MRVAIIGGGASGVLMACHLLRERRDLFAVTLIERRATVGPGVAYSTTNPDHILNVRASNMSAYADDPDHFWRWIAEKPERLRLCNGPRSFAPRRLYGEYMKQVIDDCRGEDAGLSIIRAECAAIEESASGVSAKLSTGETIAADVAILATGNDSYDWSSGSPFSSPWREDDAVAPDAPPALVLGAGLSMVDFLLASDPATRVVSLSRRGVVPQIHTQAKPIALGREEIPFGASPARFMRWLRARIKDHMAAGGDWRSVIDALRPHTQAIWRAFPESGKRSFIEHARPWWDAHRHRMAPEISDALSQAVANGRLEVIAGKLIAAKRLANGIEATFRRRGRDEAEVRMFAKIVDCRGIVVDPSQSRNPLIHALLDRGLARLDPLRIGIAVASDCAVENAAGERSRRLFAVGPLARAAFWECVAVPDIRAQCAGIARRLSAAAAGG